MYTDEKAALAGAAQTKQLRHKSYKKSYRKQAYSVIVKKDYARLNQAALNHLPRLLKACGVSFREERHEVVMLNSQRADTNYGSFRINRNTGRWGDFAVSDARGGDAVSLIAYLMQFRQSEAAQWIQRLLGGCHE